MTFFVALKHIAGAVDAGTKQWALPIHKRRAALIFASLIHAVEVLAQDAIASGIKVMAALPAPDQEVYCDGIRMITPLEELVYNPKRVPQHFQCPDPYIHCFRMPHRFGSISTAVVWASQPVTVCCASLPGGRVWAIWAR